MMWNLKPKVFKPVDTCIYIYFLETFGSCKFCGNKHKKKMKAIENEKRNEERMKRKNTLLFFV